MKKFLASLGAFCLLTSTMTGVGAYAEMGEYTLGDVNIDGTVNAIDLIITKKECLGLQEVTKNRLTLGDFNGDETIDARDLLQLKRVLLGMDEAPEQVFEVDPLKVDGYREFNNGYLGWCGNFDLNNDIHADYFGENGNVHVHFDPNDYIRNVDVGNKVSSESDVVGRGFNYCKSDDDEYVYCTIDEDSTELTIHKDRMCYYNKQTDNAVYLGDTNEEGFPVITVFDGLEEKSVYTDYEHFEVNEDGSYSVAKTCYVPNEGEKHYGVYCTGSVTNNDFILEASSGI